MTLQPSTANFSLINYSQEKDLNNLVAARKHQKNPEKCYEISILYILCQENSVAYCRSMKKMAAITKKYLNEGTTYYLILENLRSKSHSAHSWFS